MKKSILFPILAGAVIVLAVLLAISNDGNKKLNRRIAKYDIDIARLQERNDKLNEDIETQDSSIIGLQKLAEQYENQLSDARRENTSIKERWAKEKQKVTQLSGDESMDYFQCQTQAFPIIVTKTPDTAFEVPVTAIKLANEKFVSLDEEYAINDNLEKQVQLYNAQSKNCFEQLGNREKKIQLLEQKGQNYESEIALLNESITARDKITKKEARRKKFWKAGTITGVLVIAYLFIR